MKVGVLINARVGSTRLTQKHFQPIGGRPAMSELISRLAETFRAEIENGTVRLIVATGNKVENAIFEQLTVNTSAAVFYGDDLNIPRRHVEAAEAYGFDAIVSADGDDIFTAPESVRAVYQSLVRGATLVKSIGLPLGMNAWGYSRATLVAATSKAGGEVLQTGWGRIFEIADAETVALECPHADLVRATLDYESDLQFFDRCVREISDWKSLPVAAFVARIVDLNLHSINSTMNDSYWENFAVEMNAETTPSEEEYSNRLHAVIPGGAHTYSRGDDQYPANAPKILERGKGAYVWTPDGRKFLDYGMALRAVSIGYAEPEINAAAIRAIELGNGLTRASTIELEAAERLVSLIDAVDMVKFTKNGSTATSAAVKLARAYTGRDLVARCAQQPFFSYDDWFIGSTPIVRGIPQSTIDQTKTFDYNDIASLERLIARYPGQIACVILEPAATAVPATPEHPDGYYGRKPLPTARDGEPGNYLQQVESLCRRHGIVFILDEMITGFRWDLKGAQHTYGITPDLSTFGKSMSNGFSVAAVGGRREIMSLGSIDRPGQERLFLLSTTHGAEMAGLAAFLATSRFLEQHRVVDHLWQYGEALITLFNRVAAEHGLDKHLRAGGPPPNPYFMTVDDHGSPWLELRTLLVQEMIRHGILMPWLAFSFRHGEDELKMTERALNEAASVCSKAVSEGIEGYLRGPAIRPVFRRYN